MGFALRVHDLATDQAFKLASRAGILERAAALTGGMAAMATVLAWLWDWSWVFELLTHFRVQYLLALVVAAGILLVRRRYVLAGLAIPLVIANAIWVWPYARPAVVPETEARSVSPALSLVALNLQYSNRAHARVRAYLEAAAADVIVLTELTPEWAAALAPLAARYPARMLRPAGGTRGMGIWSRLPLVADDAETGASVVLVYLQSPQGRLALYAVHLESPVGPQRARLRNAELGQLAQRLRAEAGGPPMLVAGDFNLTPYSPYFRGLIEDSPLARPRPAAIAGSTWPTQFPLAAIPIDHALAGPGLEILAARRGAFVGSDHYPLEVQFRLMR